MKDLLSQLKSNIETAKLTPPVEYARLVDLVLEKDLPFKASAGARSEIDRSKRLGFPVSEKSIRRCQAVAWIECEIGLRKTSIILKTDIVSLQD